MIKDFPVKEDFFTKLMKDFDTSLETRILKSQLGDDYKLLKKAQELKQLSGIQARMPFDFEIK
jgi:protease-4